MCFVDVCCVTYGGGRWKRSGLDREINKSIKKLEIRRTTDGEGLIIPGDVGARIR